MNKVSEGINKEIQSRMSDDIFQNLLNEITTAFILSFLIICIIIFVYQFTKNDKKGFNYLKLTLAILLSLITIGITSYVAYDNNKEFKNEINTIKKESKYTNGKYKIESNYTYWDYDLEKKLDLYLKSLPYQKTKNYSSFHFNKDGEAEFYFNGKLEVKKIPELYKINPNKKPLLIYKEVDTDIYGIYKKGDIADVQFITTY